MMQYKGYIGDIRIDTEENILRGRVINTRDMITFQGRTVEEARSEFEASVDEYIRFCESRGEEPEKPYSGQFPVRANPAIHRALVIKARQKGVSLNQLVVTTLYDFLLCDTAHDVMNDQGDTHTFWIEAKSSKQYDIDTFLKALAEHETGGQTRTAKGGGVNRIKHTAGNAGDTTKAISSKGKKG